ncbi:Peroxisomal membrane protein PER10 [Spathaspora sp. JA1]|nr:Peroxisomal membrane protein PER10 [Spathaspora sp. JA1]
MNEELINSAVAFLKDPQVTNSPLTKKVEFLEAKGLNQQEIEEALRRVNDESTTSIQTIASSSSSSGTQSVRHPPPPSPQIDYYNAAPELPERSWKDYFIMATATVGITYGLYQVVNRYLIPSIIPPTQSSIDKDKERIEEEFLKVDKILEQLSADQEEMKTNNESKLKDIDTVIDNVNDFLSKYNKDKLKFDDDLRLMKLEIDNLSNSIEKNMSLTKENINEELSEINRELTSLRNLIKARSANGQSSNGVGERKIAPVSSIPSASEILKRAKAKTETTTAPAEPVPAAATPASAPETTTAPQVPETTQAVPEIVQPSAEERFGSVTLDGVTAGGIPEWQIRDKEREEQRENSVEPAAATAAVPALTTTKTEEEIQEKIANIGVPSWQLNANKAKDAGIPAWQRST